MCASKPRPATAIANVFWCRRRTPRRTCSRACTSSSRARRGRCRPSPAARRCAASGPKRSGCAPYSLDVARARRAPSRGRPTSRAARARAGGCGDALASRCGRPCRPRPRASTPARAPARPRPRRRRRGRRSPASASRGSTASASRCRRAAGLEDRRALGTRTGSAVDGQLDHAVGVRASVDVTRNTPEADDRATRPRSRPSGRGRRSTRRASPAPSSSSERQLVARRRAAVRGEPMQRLLLAHGSDAARHALAARLVAEERGDAQHDVGTRSTLVVEHHHDAGAERRAGGARALEASAACRARPGRRTRRPRRRAAPPVGRRRTPPRARSARAASCRTAPRRGRPRDVAARRRRAACRSMPRVPDRGERRRRRRARSASTFDERLDVVDDGRLAEQADLDRERRLVARLAAVALDRVEERRLLAADVRAGAAADLDVERSRAEDVVAEQAAARACDRVLRAARARADTRRGCRCSRCSQPVAKPAIVIASTTANGSSSSSTRSLNVPGSDSSALQTR